ncbi:MAG TPA: ABC transporter ATP-binding protein, partial [Flavisolibacter sp.]|nr:ABC transporter ATP-binding protein [Flavisolibacter sp.]
MRSVYVFKRLWSYIRRYKVRLLLLTSISIIGVLFEISKPFPVKLVIDNVLSHEPLPSVLNPLLGNTASLLTPSQILISCVAFLVFIVLGNMIVTLIVFQKTIWLAQRLVYDLTIDFFAKLQQLSLSFYSKNQLGDLLQRISGDVFVVYFLVAQIILPASSSLLCLGIMFYVMASIDLTLALTAFCVVPALIILVAVFAKPMDETTQTQYRKQGFFSAFIQQSLSSMKLVQAFGRELFMQQKLKEHAMDFSHAFVVANKVAMTFNQSTLLVTGLASALLLYLGARLGLKGQVSAGELFIFLSYLAALYGPVNSLVTAVGTTIAIGARGKRVFEILDSDEIVKEKPGAIDLSNVKGSIEFQNVSFGYEGMDGSPKQVLDNLTFKVIPGQVVAIVGPTGTGKTSLISLLCRFYDPWIGKIL